MRNADGDGTAGPRSTAKQLFEVFDRLRQSLLQRHLRPPVKALLGKRNVRLSPPRIVHRQRPADDLGSRACQLDDAFSKFEDRAFVRIAEVHRAGEIVRRIHESKQAFDQIVDIAERARLGAIAVDGDRLATQRLDDKVRHDAAIVAMHPRAVCVENSRDLDAQSVLAPIVEEQRLGTPLTLVVACPWAYRIYVAPIRFHLRVDVGIAVHFGCRCLKDLRVDTLGQSEHVDRAVHVHLRGLHRIILVVDWRSRTGEIEYSVDLDVEWKRDVVPQDLEARVGKKGSQVRARAGVKVVDAQDLVTLVEDALAKV